MCVDIIVNPDRDDRICTIQTSLKPFQGSGIFIQGNHDNNAGWSGMAWIVLLGGSLLGG